MRGRERTGGGDRRCITLAAPERSEKMDLRRGRALGWTALICLLMIPIGTVTASAAAPDAIG